MYLYFFLNPNGFDALSVLSIFIVVNHVNDVSLHEPRERFNSSLSPVQAYRAIFLNWTYHARYARSWFISRQKKEYR